jgi:hypothetical protein
VGSKIGDLAASQGKSFDQLTEAILDAQTGEFERLKEFGIQGKKNGDQVSLSFKGVTKDIQNTDEAIRNALLQFGEMEGVAGAMEGISKTIGGQISNIGDGIDTLLNNIGKKFEPVIAGALSIVGQFFGQINEFFTGSNFENFFDGIVESLRSYYEVLSAVVQRIGEWAQKTGLIEKLQAVFQGLFDVIGVIYDVLGKVIDVMQDLYDAGGPVTFIVDAIGTSIHQVLDGVLLLIEGVKNIPFAFEAARAFIVQSVTNIRNSFNAMVDDIKVIGLELKKAFTFDDGAEAAIQTRIDFLRKEAAKLRSENVSPAEAAKNAYNTAKAEAEAAAKARKEARDKEAAQTGDTGPVRGRAIASSTAPLSNKQRQDAEKAARDRVKMEQDANARLLKLQNDLLAAQVAGIKDEDQQKQAALLADFERKNKELEAEKKKLSDMAKTKKDYTAEAAAIDKQSIEAINDLQIQLESNKNKELEKLQQEQLRKRLELQLSYRQQLNEFQNEGLAKDIEAINIEAEQRELAIREQYKNETELRDRLIKASQEAADNARKSATNATADKQLQSEQEVGEATLKYMYTYGDKRFQTEEKYQQALLELQLKYSRQRLELLKQNTDEESKQAAAALEAQIKNMEGELNGLKAKTGAVTGVSVLEFLGIDLSNTGADAEKINKTLADIKDNVFSFLSDIADRRIEDREENIEQLDEQIDETQEAYERELQLAEDGRANDVDGKKKQLDELKKQRDEEIKQLQEAQKQKQAIQKAQLITDSIAQVTNLITASTEIFSAFAGIPFVGVPLAIAAIAAMFGAFAVAKVKAWNSIETASMGEGGVVDGPSHAQGGKKYYADNGTHVELEGGEYVTRKSKTAKYFPILDAINRGRLSEIGPDESSFRMMLSEMGISLSDDKQVEDSVSMFVQNEKNTTLVLPNKESAYMEEISSNLAYLADRKKNDEVILEDNPKYMIVKKGNTKRKIFK